MINDKAPEFWVAAPGEVKGGPMNPSDYIEVVRCCECKKCMTIANKGDDEPLLLCEHWNGYPRVEPTDFCSCGERSANA